jgi:hypothetical protein
MHIREEIVCNIREYALIQIFIPHSLTTNYLIKKYLNYDDHLYSNDSSVEIKKRLKFFYLKNNITLKGKKMNTLYLKFNEDR